MALRTPVRLVASLLAGFVVVGMASAPATASAPKVYVYPSAPRGTHVDHYFGTAVADPYRWLEDSRSAKTARWVTQERSLTRSYLNTLPTLTSRTSQMRGLLDYPRVGVPIARGTSRFWSYNPGTSAQSIIEVGDADGQNARTLVDPNALSTSGTVSVPQWAPDWTGRTLAWATSDQGSDWRTIRFTDVASGSVLADTLTGARFTSLAWTPDGTGLYYSRYTTGVGEPGQAASNQQLYLHRLGTAQESDTLVLDDPAHPTRRFWAAVSPQTNRLWVAVIESSQAYSWRMQDLSVAGGPLTEVVPGVGISQLVTDTDEGPIIYTNYEATHGRLVKALIADPRPTAWRSIVPETAATIDSWAVGGDRIAVETLQDATSRVDTYAMDGSDRRSVKLPGIGSVKGMEDGAGPAAAYLDFSSFTSPPTVFSLDAATNTLQPWHAPAATANASARARILTTQAWVTSKDGTRLPVFIVRRADVRADGTNPTLLYGYGGFNIPVTPDYQPFVLAWVERGGIYVSANLRGGSEYGTPWHEAGMKKRKQHVFDDYIAAAQWLIARKWTTASHLGITGRSNGGLLVGAAMTQRPDLFGAAIPIVGVMDMLRYQEFTIGAAWSPEYGTSKDSAAMFRYLRSYSPLHALRPGVSYPATMVMTAEQDDRVVPAHSFKFAATLQQDNANTRPMLIRITPAAGHGGGSSGGGSMQQDISDSADRLAFLDANIGGRGPSPAPVFRRARS